MSRCPECTRLGHKAPRSGGPASTYLCTNEGCPVRRYAGRAVLHRKPVASGAAPGATRRPATP